MELINDYKDWKASQAKKSYLYYNVLEKLIINVDLN